MNLMGGFIANNLDKKKHYDLLDFGSFINKGQTLNHRQLLEEYDVTYTGVDIQAGRNVDIQMTQPYKIPLPSNSQDVVLSGQVFETSRSRGRRSSRSRACCAPAACS